MEPHDAEGSPAPTASAAAPPAGLIRQAPEISPRVHRLILLLVASTALLGGAGAAFSPYLLVEHPLWLVGLNPDSRHLVFAAARTDAFAFALVAAPRRALSFLATYALARRYGYAAVTWVEKRYPRASRLIRFVERIYLRLGIWLVLLVPLYWVAAIAGVGQMRLRSYVLAMLPGQLAFVLAWYYLGAALEDWTAPFLAWLSRNVVPATVVCVAAVVLQQLHRRWRRGGTPAG